LRGSMGAKDSPARGLSIAVVWQPITFPRKNYDGEL
jgi:hypothetical protein